MFSVLPQQIKGDLNRSAICEQKTVGTTVKTSADDDPIGVITALSLQRYHQLDCLKELHHFLVKQCRDKEVKPKLEKVRLVC